MKKSIKGQVEININAPIAKVWDALTNPKIIKQYFFGTDTTTDWKVGSPIKFSGEWQGKTYEDKGTVLAFEKNRLVKYSYWSSMSGMDDQPENYVNVSYELSGVDGSVDLTIIQENIPDENMREHSEENWKKVMNGLKKVVEEKSGSVI
jgi:uncharacterized protein YndB with AHSA1/START domain